MKMLQKHYKQHHLSITGERHLVSIKFFKWKYVIKQDKTLTDVWHLTHISPEVECVWNVMAHAQKPDFIFRW